MKAKKVDPKRIPIDADDEVSAGEHKHKCSNCGNAWKHSNKNLGDVKAHTCSKCGEEEWDKYHTPRNCDDDYLNEQYFEDWSATK